ncbi:unnamed protein product, partial [Hymenolepis diminuta]
MKNRIQMNFLFYGNVDWINYRARRRRDRSLSGKFISGASLLWWPICYCQILR